MSETDDTDVLLLIPPDFFLVRSSGSDDSILESSRTVVHKPKSCTAQVIGKLVDQVHSLESRLESLEISTDTSFASLPRQRKWESDSFDNQSLDRKSFTFPRRRRRKVSKKERTLDLSVTSVGSTSSKRSVPRLKLNFELASVDSKTSANDSHSMDDISSILSTPSKKNDRLLLHEIDEFLTKVESYESPESKFKERESTLTPENVIKATGDYMSQKLDSRSNDEVKLPSGRILPSHMLDKYIYLVKNSSQAQSDKSLPSTSTSSYKAETYNSNAITETPKPQEESKVVDSKSPSIRRLNFSEHKDIQPTSTPKKQTAFVDTFRPSSNKIYDRASKVLEQYKSQNYNRSQISDPSLSKEEFKLPQMRPYVADCKDEIRMHRKLMDTIDTDLLSLSELWGERVVVGERGDGKLEEERLKREHCESMIQQLQKKVLEQQEKLAVAVKVDRAKDLAIAKLRDAWLKLTGSLDRAEERQRTTLEKMARDVESSKAVASEAQKKTSHFESELYKALDLAHDYQEKHKQLQMDLKKLQEDKDRAIAEKEEAVRAKEKEIEVLKENYDTVMRLNKQSSDFVKNLEQILEKERSDHELTKNKFKEFHHKIEAANEETALVAQERDALRDKVSEERARWNMLERQLAEKQNQVGELMSKYEAMESERSSLRSGLEQQRSALRAHYQQQLETAVRAKLQEFQHQLDRAQRELQQSHGAQLSAHALQIDTLQEQHKLEVKVLEEKQKEEIKLYRLQLAQANEKVGLLESKLESVRRRRGALAAQLHGVMETQWRAACRLLTAATHTHSEHSEHTPHTTQALTPPMSVRPELNLDGLSETELQHYIKMLLSKPATLNGSDPPQDAEEPTSDRADPHCKDKGVKRILNASKPPWKA